MQHPHRCLQSFVIETVTVMPFAAAFVAALGQGLTRLCASVSAVRISSSFDTASTVCVVS